MGLYESLFCIVVPCCPSSSELASTICHCVEDYLRLPKTKTRVMGKTRLAAP